MHEQHESPPALTLAVYLFEKSCSKNNNNTTPNPQNNDKQKGFSELSLSMAHRSALSPEAVTLSISLERKPAWEKARGEEPELEQQDLRPVNGAT